LVRTLQWSKDSAWYLRSAKARDSRTVSAPGQTAVSDAASSARYDWLTRASVRSNAGSTRTGAGSVAGAGSVGIGAVTGATNTGLLLRLGRAVEMSLVAGGPGTAGNGPDFALMPTQDTAAPAITATTGTTIGHRAIRRAGHAWFPAGRSGGLNTSRLPSVAELQSKTTGSSALVCVAIFQARFGATTTPRRSARDRGFLACFQGPSSWSV
jgi:hypothetical protein